MKFITLSSLVALASAASVDLTKRATALDVTVELVGNSALKAVLTNNGAEPLKVLKTGTILDTEVPVEKSEVFSGSDKIAFDGVRIQLDLNAVTEANFRVIEAGESIEVEWDNALAHDLSKGGEFDFRTVGAFPFAEGESTHIVGTVQFSSNTVHATVDAAEAAKVRREFHDSVSKRAAVQADCTGTRRTNTISALAGCRRQALAAATQASSGAAARMTEFFKSSTSATRSTVAGVFNRIASECGSTTSGAPQYCTDVLGGVCTSGVVAYTVPAQGYMVNCPYYFSFPVNSNGCYSISQSSTTLHEATHLRTVRGTTDYCYGISCVRGLTASQALNNADTYTLFAQSISAGC